MSLNFRCNQCRKPVMPFAVNGIIYCEKCIRNFNKDERRAILRMSHDNISSGMTPAQYIQIMDERKNEACAAISNLFYDEEEKQDITNTQNEISMMLYNEKPNDFPLIIDKEKISPALSMYLYNKLCKYKISLSYENRKNNTILIKYLGFKETIQQQLISLLDTHKLYFDDICVYFTEEVYKSWVIKKDIDFNVILRSYIAANEYIDD